MSLTGLLPPRVSLFSKMLWILLLTGCGSGSGKIISQLDDALIGRGYGSDASAMIENILAHRVGGYPIGIHPHVRTLLADPFLAIDANELSFMPTVLSKGDDTITDWQAPEDLPYELQIFLTNYIGQLVNIQKLVIDARSEFCCDFISVLDGLAVGNPFIPVLEDLLASLDQKKMEKAIAAFVVSNENLLEKLRELSLESLSGLPARSFRSPIGKIQIASSKNDWHEGGSGLILDLGGDDKYQRSETKPDEISVIIDLSGDDQYNGPDISFGGVAVLADLAGNDRYFTPGAGLGATIGGLSWLQDETGNDHYFATTFGMGAAIAGFGILIDAKGDDDYHVKSHGQGFGGPAGYGKLQDFSGNDSYFAAEGLIDPFVRKSGTLSYAQGVGIGFRPGLPGGIGALRDGSGDDSYFAEMFAQGQGYFFGFGILEDSDGNDAYTSTRYSQGQGSFSGIGLLFDLAGEDDYQLEVGVGQGMGLDTGIGVLADFEGNDRYTAPNLAQGSSTGNGLGFLADVEGADIYYLNKPGLGWGRGRGARGLPGLPLHIDIGDQAHYILSGELILDIGPGGLGGPLAGVELALPRVKGFECPNPEDFPASMAGHLIDRLSRSAPKFGLGESALREFVGLYRFMPDVLPKLLGQITVNDVNLISNLGALVSCYLKEADDEGREQVGNVLVQTLRTEHPLASVIISWLQTIPPSPEIALELGSQLQHHNDCGVRAGALLLLRRLDKIKEPAWTLARHALKDSCWQVKSAALLLLARIEGNTLATVPSAIYDKLPSPLKSWASIASEGDASEDW